MLSTADRVHRSVAEAPVLARPWAARPRLVRERPRLGTAPADGRTRRILNVIVAAIGILLTAPIMMVLALLVKLTSPGPVLYVQTRVGIDRRAGKGGNWRRTVDYGGRLFTIYKFRTMHVRPPHLDDQVWAKPDDPRVTRIGGVLRKYRLDELPQLFNVLKGDMNIVGPRPEQPRIFIQLREQIDRYPERQRVLPGITGWAQVNLHYDRNIDDVKRKLQLDLEYANRVSAMADLEIMLRTFPVILLRRGAW